MSYNEPFLRNMLHYRWIDAQTDSETERQTLIGLCGMGVQTFACFSFTWKSAMLGPDRKFCNFACFRLLKSTNYNVNYGI